ncbi:hypothetical protein ACR3K2_29750 [Cryptosporidium serpentis]
MVVTLMSSTSRERRSNNTRYITPVSAAEKSIPAVPAPDEKTYKVTVESIRSVLNDWNLKIRNLTQLINERSIGRETFDRKKGDLQSKLDEYQKQIDNFEEERKSLMTKIEEKSREGKEMKNQLSNLKKAVGYKSEEEIEAKIKDIEYLLVTSTISLKEEKKLLAQISQLKQHRPVVGKFAHMDASASSFEENSILPLRSKVSAVIEELNKYRRMKKDVYEKLRSLTLERQKALEPLRSLYEERSMMQNKAEEQHNKLRAIREEYDKEMKKFQEYQQKLRSIRSERIKEEKAMRELFKRRDELKLALEREDDPPISPEMLLAQQALGYIQQLMQNHRLVDDTVDSDKNEAEVHPTSSAIKGSDKDESILLPKNQRDEEYLLPPTKLKNKKKIHSNFNNSKSLVVDLVTIATFKEMNLDVPLTVDDLPNCLNQLKEKYSLLKKEVDEKYANREKRKEEILKQLHEVEKKIVDSGGITDDFDLKNDEKSE